MATQLLNQQAYEVGADNLVSAKLTSLHRLMTIANPKVAIKRGMAVVNDGGTLYVAGTEGHDKDVIGIISADREADTASDEIAVDLFVFGAYNAAFVTGVNDWDATTMAHILGAQANGIYLV